MATLLATRELHRGANRQTQRDQHKFNVMPTQAGTHDTSKWKVRLRGPVPWAPAAACPREVGGGSDVGSGAGVVN